MRVVEVFMTLSIDWYDVEKY